MSSIIKQTNRTILFEEINPEKLDLLTGIGDVRGMESIPDDKVKDIHELLLVHSFQEFLEKFEPKVFSFFDSHAQKVIYTLKKPGMIPAKMLNEIPLNQENDFLKMLMTLVDTKRSQGIKNADFKFENLTDMISPKKVMDDIRRNRKELQDTYAEYNRLENGDPQKTTLADKLNVMLEKASANYNNIMAMLPLAIEDIKTRLLLRDGRKQKDFTSLVLGVLSMGDDGELKILGVPKVNQTSPAVIEADSNTGLIAALSEDYEALNEEPNDYVKALVTRTFCPLASVMVAEVDIAREVENYNTYLTFYKEAKDDFITAVKPLIEKILGIWTFFEQYPKHLNGMRPSLVITNVSNEMLVKASNTPRLLAYLNTMNAKNDFENSIWYGIVPSVSLGQHSKMNLTRERFKGNSTDKKSALNSMESLAKILAILKDYSVQCFFSYETGDKTTFHYMATEGIDKFEDHCIPLINKEYSEYAIPCIPNFTIIPKEKSGVILDKKMVVNANNLAHLSQEKEDIMKLWIDGIYVGAAYLAAGLVASYQCPEYLRQKFTKNVDPNLPGVRFDIEARNHALLVHTTMAKEITGFTNEVKNDLNHKHFGFVFSSENALLNGRNITNIMVYKARNLMAVNSIYEPIFKTQVITYIERILRHATSDFKQDQIVQFFSNNPNSQKNRWLSGREFINAILENGDDIQCRIDELNGYCILDVTLNGNVKNLEIEINRLNTAGMV